MYIKCVCVCVCVYSIQDMNWVSVICFTVNLVMLHLHVNSTFICCFLGKVNFFIMSKHLILFNFCIHVVLLLYHLLPQGVFCPLVVVPSGFKHQNWSIFPVLFFTVVNLNLYTLSSYGNSLVVVLFNYSAIRHFIIKKNIFSLQLDSSTLIVSQIILILSIFLHSYSLMWQLSLSAVSTSPVMYWFAFVVLGYLSCVITPFLLLVCFTNLFVPFIVRSSRSLSLVFKFFFLLYHKLLMPVGFYGGTDRLASARDLA